MSIDGSTREIEFQCVPHSIKQFLRLRVFQKVDSGVPIFALAGEITTFEEFTVCAGLAACSRQH